MHDVSLSASIAAEAVAGLNSAANSVLDSVGERVDDRETIASLLVTAIDGQDEISAQDLASQLAAVAESSTHYPGELSPAALQQLATLASALQPDLTSTTEAANALPDVQAANVGGGGGAEAAQRGERAAKAPGGGGKAPAGSAEAKRQAVREAAQLAQPTNAASSTPAAIQLSHSTGSGIVTVMYIENWNMKKNLGPLALGHWPPNCIVSSRHQRGEPQILSPLTSDENFGSANKC